MGPCFEGPILGLLNREVSSKPGICAEQGAMDPSSISLTVWKGFYIYSKS